MKKDLYNIQPYRFYMLDYNPAQQFSLYYYMERLNHDNCQIDQYIKKIFIDIEVFTEFDNKFPEPKHANKPINCITLITDKGDIKTYFLLYEEQKINTDEYVIRLQKQIKDEYDFDINKIEINLYRKEEELLQDIWKYIHEYDPAILVGFNSDYFDFPYIINRCINLFGRENATKLITKFNEFKISGFHISLPDYQLVDILKMYKPGEGFGFGKNLDKFNLDTVAEVELGVKKVAYEEMTLDELYVKNPYKFIYYNIIDTYLIYMLDKKLKHFDLFNSQRRLTYCPVSRAYHGRSVMGEQLQTYNELIKSKQVPRSFLSKEKIAINDKEEEFKTYSLSLSYYGAYVKSAQQNVYDGLIIDLDQSLPFDQLILIRRNNKIYEIPIGRYIFEENDETLTLDFNNQICWKKVKGIVEHKNIHDIVKIETKNGRIIKTTLNHSIFIYNDEEDKIKLVDAANIVIGTKLIVKNETSNEYITDEVIKYTKFPRFIEKYVYDISVEDTERFFARDPKSNGYILVHNTSMYPSLIKMFNLEYATFYAKIYNNSINTFMHQLEMIINKRDDKRLKKVLDSIWKKLEVYIKDIKGSNRYKDEVSKNKEYIKEMIYKIYDSNYTFNDIINNRSYYLFKTKLIPLLEIIELILSQTEYNQYIYDYLMLDTNKFIKKYENEKIYVYMYPTNSNSYIRIMNVHELIDELLNNYIVTITGCLFYKHQEKTGHIINTINELMPRRSKLKSKLKELDPNTKEYELLDREQTSIKVLLNSFYGIYGLSTYRYNEKNIANTITISGRLLLKSAQYIAEKTTEEFVKKQLV